MKTERAIELLNRISDEQFDGIHGDERREALSMAVRALVSQQTVNDSQGLVNDCISRKMAIDAFEPEHDTDWYTPTIIEVLEALPPAQPETHDKRTKTHACDLISRQAAIDALHTWFKDGFDEDKRWNSTHVLAAIEGLPPVQQEHKWETCFDCPLSHGCPKIKGCTNEQAMLYSSQIPNDCPLSAQFERKTEGDTINRQAAMVAVKDALLAWSSMPEWRENKVLEAIIGLPSAQPERKMGKWIPVDSFSAFGGDEAMWMAHGNPVAFYYCSECKEQAYAGEDGESLLTDFCPSCGADMRGKNNAIS